MSYSKKEATLISIIIPCYNCSSTIVKTLESLEKQSYPNIEVLLINDGSNDETEKVINDYVKSSKLVIRYFLEPNKGVSVARNLGIQEAKGIYILFLDSDDIYHFDYVRCLFEVVDSKNMDTAYCYWSRDIDTVFDDISKVSECCISVLTQKELMNEFLYNKGKIGFGGFIYCTDIIHKYSIRFTSFRKTFEDVEFTWKYLSHCKSGIKIDSELYGYRDTPNSALKAIYWERTESLKSIVAIEDYLKANNCDFYEEFKGYMYSRAIWSYAKTFSRGKRKDLYDKLKTEYDVKYHMNKMVFKGSNWLVRISAIFYCIHPDLFYFIISLV